MNEYNQYMCPHCFADNQEMFTRTSTRIVYCAACNKDFEIEEERGMNIQVQRMYRFDTDRPLKAFADIIIDDVLLIKGIKVLAGKNGLFVSMPQEQAKDKKWYESVRCLTQEVKEQITACVLDAYDEGDDEPELDNALEPSDALGALEDDDDVIIP